MHADFVKVQYSPQIRFQIYPGLTWQIHWDIQRHCWIYAQVEHQKWIQSKQFYQDIAQSGSSCRNIWHRKQRWRFTANSQFGSFWWIENRNHDSFALKMCWNYSDDIAGRTFGGKIERKSIKYYSWETFRSCSLNHQQHWKSSGFEIWALFNIWTLAIE